MKIVIASDSFKGSLTSEEVAEAASEGIHAVFPDCTVCRVCVADGGEGTADAILKATGGRTVSVKVHDPLMRPVTAAYAITADGGTAIIETAAASGLPLLSETERNPMKTSTFGTGEMIADAAGKGCRHFLIGLGGSATNDAGTGLLTALGFRFTDKEGRLLDGKGESLEAIAAVDTSGVPEEIKASRFTAACDVDIPFCGPEGAAYIFSPQKGADKGMAKALDRGMASFASITFSSCGKDIRGLAGAGAAGGLGGALAAYLGAELVPGAEMILDAVGFDTMIRDADLIITGEGRLDSQTSRGKIPYAVLQHATEKGIPVIAITGSVPDRPGPDCSGFSAVFPVIPRPQALKEAMDRDNAIRNIRRTVFQIMRTMKISL